MSRLRSGNRVLERHRLRPSARRVAQRAVHGLHAARPLCGAARRRGRRTHRSDQLDDPEAQVRALWHAGVAAERLCRFDEAINWDRRAANAARRPGVDDLLLQSSLDSLALTHLQVGHTERAVQLLEQTLAIGRESGPTMHTALHLYHYGMALTAAGRLADAEAAHTGALRINQDQDHSQGTGYVEQALADVDIRRGRLSTAAQRLDRARHAHERIGAGDGLAETLRSTADLAAADGRWSEAITGLYRALDIWRRIGSRIEIARTLARLQRAHTAAGASKAAARCRDEYQTILADLALDDNCLHIPPFYPE